MREALLLDLGAIIFELHRQGRREPELLQSKAADLAEVDVEVRALTDALGEGYGLPELTAHGLVAACTACGAIMGVRDRHCPNCGAAAGAPAGIEDGEDEPALEEPEYDEEGIEVSAAEPQPVGAARRPASNGDVPPWYAGPPPPPASAPLQQQEEQQEQRDPIVPRAQRTMRAGRRLARAWIEERRSDSR